MSEGGEPLDRRALLQATGALATITASATGWAAWPWQKLPEQVLKPARPVVWQDFLGLNAQLQWFPPEVAAQCIEPVGTRHQRVARLATHPRCGKTGVVLGDIRRIGDHQLETPPLEAGKPVARFERNVAEPESPGIHTGKVHRRRIAIDSEHPPRRTLARQRKRDRPTAGAEIEHIGRSRSASHQRKLDQQLGLRSRYQRVAVERDIERPERLPPEQVGDRFAGSPPFEQRKIAST